MPKAFAQSEPANLIPYPVTYQRELSPIWLRFAAALSGSTARDPAQPFRYLELGCGRGYSSLVHGASHPHGEFYAIDKDRDAIARAAKWARRADVGNVQFITATFEDALSARLPLFDFIVLHGVYSWVEPRERANIRKVLRDHLADGGLAYVSYNCFPGWAAELPLRRILRELSGVESDRGRARVREAARTVERLRESGLGYLSANPTADLAVASWASRDEGYLAHEYLAEHWEPLWSADVGDEMEELGLAFAGSATLHDNFVALQVDERAAASIAELGSERLQRLALDLAVNRSFRRDLFVKRDNHVATAGDALLDKLFVGRNEAEGEVADAIVVPRGRIRFRSEFVAAFCNLVRGGARPIGEIVHALAPSGQAAETRRNLLWLTAGGVFSPLAGMGLAGIRRRLAQAAATG